MTSNRLEKIELVCHNCSYTGHLNYDLLNKKLGSNEPLSLKNIGELLHYFLCSKCRAKILNYMTLMEKCCLIQIIM